MSTLTLTVSAAADDAQENQDDTGFTSTGSSNNLNAAASPTAATRKKVGFRFTGASAAAGATINSGTYLEVYLNNGAADDALLDIYTEAADSPADFTTTADVQNRALGANSVAWVADAVGAGGNAYYQSPDLATPVNDATSRAGFAGTLMVILVGRSTGSKNLSIDAQENASAKPAKLTINYTAAATNHGPAIMGVRVDARPIIAARGL